MKYIPLLVTLLLFAFAASAQPSSGKITGYVYEVNNRGYLNEVQIKVTHPRQAISYTTNTDQSGKFELLLPIVEGDYLLTANKAAFEKQSISFSMMDSDENNNKFLKIEMERQPGYILDMSLSDLVVDEDKGASYGIENAHIEVYNNTTQEEVMNIEAHPYHSIKVLLEQGNEYIFMVRKEGYYTKRMRANVNINGCILCMEGFGSVEPGITDNLTEENTRGMLGANVLMKKMILGENLKLDKIYYDLGKATLRPEAKTGLNQLIQLLRDNPNIIVELSSHTDSRGSNSDNISLSQRRANGVIQYIKQNMSIDKDRITAKGYGESRLVNSCSDGVSCSDEMHQQNRRTELTILDILAHEAQNTRSLASIMQEKNFDKILDANTEAYAESTAPSSTGSQSASTPLIVEGDYTGYKIELVVQSGEISLEHPIFYQFDKVFIDFDKNNENAFLIGDFTTKEAAAAALNHYKKQFPTAKIVAYKEGVRS